MAEAVGCASAIASLVVIAAQITRLSYGLISDFKNAPKKQKLYLQEVSALVDVLLRAEQAASDSKTALIVGTRPASIPSPVLSEAHEELLWIQKCLEGGMGKAKWLLKEKDLRTRIDQLQKFRGVFAEYIGASTLVVTTAIYSKVEKLDYEATRDKLLKWLRGGDGTSGSLPTASAGTGTNFSASKEYIRWRDNGFSWEHPESLKERLLWCRGAPGTEKSVLASIAIRDLLNRSPEKQSLVAYYFCDFAIRKQQTLKAILLSLSSQFARQADELPLESMAKIQK